jgi:hypothetical protein
MTDGHVPARFFGRDSDSTEQFNVNTFKEGTLKIWSQGPVWVTQVKGYGSVELVTQMCKNGTEHGRRQGMIVTIHDWFEVTSPDKRSRGILQEYAKQQQVEGQAREIVIACDSILLKVSISAANIVLGNRLEAILDYPKFVARFEDLRKAYGC